MGGICPSCIACEMILAMLSNLPLGKQLNEIVFSLGHYRDFKIFSCGGCHKGKGRLTLPKAILTGSSTPLANTAMDIPPVSTIDVSRLMSLMLNIAMDRSIFLPFVHIFQFD